MILLLFIRVDCRFLQYNKAQHNFKNFVFLDIRRANPIFGLCLYCIFVRNTIYVIQLESIQVVRMARDPIPPPIDSYHQPMPQSDIFI